MGAGEGADNVWLARNGWSVTAIEPSPTAAARITHAAVTVVNRTLEEADLPAQSFGLVSCFYPALFRTPDNTAQRSLTDLVAPGGTLLMVSHADADVERALAHGFNPADYIDHDAMRDFLSDDGNWEILHDERRARSVSGGGGAHHHEDLILMARKM